MIALLRIDERLIHGQVATSWSKALDIDTNAFDQLVAT